MKAKTRAEKIGEYHQRQLEHGWRRLSLRLPPDAAAALDKLLAAQDATAVGVVGALLVEAARQLPGRRNH